jgi:hypothetical protein
MIYKFHFIYLQTTIPNCINKTQLHKKGDGEFDRCRCCFKLYFMKIYLFYLK